MTAHFTRGNLLLHQSRHEQAADEFRQHLLENPNDPLGHAHLALCLAEMKDFKAATEHARQAVALAPDVGFSHFVVANVMVKRNRLKEAKTAIDEAIQLEPHVPMFFFLRGLISGEEHQWESALADADAGLEIDPEDAECLNLRAQSLMKLGRRLEAGESLETALREDPDNALTHATRGWSLLEQGQQDEAMTHFREALRLDPEFEWARAGIVEGMKAKHFIYRIFLGYIFWMMRLSPRARWGIVIGGYIGYRLMASVAESNPALGVWLLPLMIAYVGFALMTWLAGPLFNLLLRMSRFGRLALSRDQTWAANLFGSLLLVAIALLAAGVWSGNQRMVIAALYTALLMLPASSIFVCPAGWPRWTMAGVTLLLAAVGAAELASVVMANGRMMQTRASQGLGQLFLYGILGSQLLANALVGIRIKH